MVAVTGRWPGGNRSGVSERPAESPRRSELANRSHSQLVALEWCPRIGQAFARERQNLKRHETFRAVTQTALPL